MRTDVRPLARDDGNEDDDDEHVFAKGVYLDVAIKEKTGSVVLCRLSVEFVVKPQTLQLYTSRDLQYR